MYFTPPPTINYVVVDLHIQRSFTTADLGGVAALLGVNPKKLRSMMKDRDDFFYSERFVISKNPKHIKSRRGGAFYFPNSK